MHKNINRSWLGSNTRYLSTQAHVHTCTRTSTAPGWAQTSNIYRLKHTYIHEKIVCSWLGLNPWYVLTQTHIHAREHRPPLVGLQPLIFIDSNTHTCTRTSATPGWAQIPDIYRLKHTYMYMNIGYPWLSPNPWYLSTHTHIHVREHRPLLIGLKPLIFIDSNTHTCTITSAAPGWAQTPDPPVFNPVNVRIMCSCVFILTHKSIGHRDLQMLLRFQGSCGLFTTYVTRVNVTNISLGSQSRW